MASNNGTEGDMEEDVEDDDDMEVTREKKNDTEVRHSLSKDIYFMREVAYLEKSCISNFLVGHLSYEIYKQVMKDHL